MLSIKYCKCFISRGVEFHIFTYTFMKKYTLCELLFLSSFLRQQFSYENISNIYFTIIIFTMHYLLRMS